MTRLDELDRLKGKLEKCTAPPQSLIEKRVGSFIHDLLRELDVNVDEEEILTLSEDVISKIQATVHDYNAQNRVMLDFKIGCEYESADDPGMVYTYISYGVDKNRYFFRHKKTAVGTVTDFDGMLMPLNHDQCLMLKKCGGGFGETAIQYVLDKVGFNNLAPVTIGGSEARSGYVYRKLYDTSRVYFLIGRGVDGTVFAVAVPMKYTSSTGASQFLAELYEAEKLLWEKQDKLLNNVVALNTVDESKYRRIEGVEADPLVVMKYADEAGIITTYTDCRIVDMIGTGTVYADMWQPNVYFVFKCGDEKVQMMRFHIPHDEDDDIGCNISNKVLAGIEGETVSGEKSSWRLLKVTKWRLSKEAIKYIKQKYRT